MPKKKKKRKVKKIKGGFIGLMDQHENKRKLIGWTEKAPSWKADLGA